MRTIRWLVTLVSFACPAIYAQPTPEQLSRVRQNPNDWALHHQIAIAYTQSQQLEQAATHYSTAIRLKPDLVPARKNLATVLWFLGRKTESEIMFRQLLRAIPNDPVPHLYLGLGSAGQHRYAMAKRHFQLAGELAISNPEALPAVAEAFLATKDRSIVAIAERLIPEATKVNNSYLNQMSSVFNRFEEWQATVRFLEPAPPADTDAAMLLAEAYDKLGKPEAAYAVYSRSASAQTADERLYLAFAIFASRHQNVAFGLDILDTGIDRLPNSWKLPMQKGLLLALRGDRSAAETCLRSAIAKNHGDPSPLLALGVLHLESGNLPDAIALFSSAASKDRANLPANYFHAFALYRTGTEENRRVAEAITRKLLIGYPNDSNSHLLLGRILLADAKLAGATTEFRRAVALDSENTAALYQLSLACKRSGQSAQADRYMNRFRRLKADLAQDENQLVQILKIVR